MITQPRIPEALELRKAAHGGYMVSEVPTGAHYAPVLFAGELGACLRFMEASFNPQPVALVDPGKIDLSELMRAGWKSSVGIADIGHGYAISGAGDGKLGVETNEPPIPISPEADPKPVPSLLTGREALELKRSIGRLADGRGVDALTIKRQHACWIRDQLDALVSAREEQSAPWTIEIWRALSRLIVAERGGGILVAPMDGKMTVHTWVNSGLGTSAAKFSNVQMLHDATMWLAKAAEALSKKESDQ